MPVSGCACLVAADWWDDRFGLGHSSTFANNNVACRVGRAVLATLTADGFAEAVARLGIRTVVNLQDDNTDPDLPLTFWSARHVKESAWCARLGVRSSRLFLGRLLSSRACLRFAGRERFSKTKPRRTIIFQPTATTPLNPCLSQRVHSNHSPPRKTAEI